MAKAETWSELLSLPLQVWEGGGEEWVGEEWDREGGVVSCCGEGMVEGCWRQGGLKACCMEGGVVGCWREGGLEASWREGEVVGCSREGTGGFQQVGGGGGWQEAQSRE